MHTSTFNDKGIELFVVQNIFKYEIHKTWILFCSAVGKIVLLNDNT